MAQPQTEPCGRPTSDMITSFGHARFKVCAEPPDHAGSLRTLPGEPTMIMCLSRSTAVAAAVLLICVTACASSGNTEVTSSRTRVSNPNSSSAVDVTLRNREVAAEQDVNLSVARAQEALPAAYVKLGIKDAAVVSTAGGMRTFGVRNLRLHGSLGGVRLSAYLDCGSAAMYNPATSYDVNFSATTHVTPREGGATLHTLVTADARDPMSNTPSVHCSSTGAFERNVAQLVGAAQP